MGLVPFWAKDEHVGYKMINARVEGIDKKPAFKRALVSQRCLIPAPAFFEWKAEAGQKTKYRIGRKDGEMFGFAGLYDIWRSPNGNALKSCTIITTPPDKVVEPIHDRMPAILLPEDEEAWLKPRPDRATRHPPISPALSR